MSGPDQLTQNRLAAKLRVLLRKIEALYAKHPKAPDSPFWAKLDELDLRIGREIQKRPLSNMDIERMFAVFEQKFAAILAA